MFGSVARGEDTADSDVDVLIVLDKYTPSEAIKLKQRAARASGVPAPYAAAFSNPDRMTRRQAVVGTLERAAVRKGRRVFVRG